MAAPPSVFSSLLRRSKFASYDPSIAQVYTTYHGFAHRGDWGLKRPLIKSKLKSSFKTISSVDSHEQQTEWHNAEQPARWIRSFAELGKEPSFNDKDGKWREVVATHEMNHYDSEFSRHTTGGHSSFGGGVSFDQRQKRWTSPTTHRNYGSHHFNIAALHPRRFEKYLSHLRRVRPQFKATVLRESRSQATRHLPIPDTHKIFHLKSGKESLLDAFVDKEYDGAFIQPRSAKLLPCPHSKAGLSYTRSSELTNYYLYDPVPARILTGTEVGGSKLKKPQFGSLTVGVGGMIADLYSGDSYGRKPAKLDDTEQHHTPFYVRVNKMVLTDPPHIMHVQDGRGFERAAFEVSVNDDKHLKSMMWNPNRPGSRAYIAHSDSGVRDLEKSKRTVAPMRSPSQWAAVAPKPDQQSKDVLNQLEDMISVLIPK